jgi:hypothetical protein
MAFFDVEVGHADGFEACTFNCFSSVGMLLFNKFVTWILLVDRVGADVK